MFWEPPLDPDQPQCPYLPGFAIRITEHEPPPPFGLPSYPLGTRSFPSDAWLRETPQILQVIGNPPQDTTWRSSSPPRTATFNITKGISIGQNRGAQLVVCEVLVCGQKSPYTAVAKIYDPLYYSPRHSFAESVPQDVVLVADTDYSCEAAAYSYLQTTKSLQKPGFAPEYYGSWTFELPLTLQGKKYRRSIRLILIEHLPGSSIRDLYKRKHGDYSFDNSSEPNAFHYDEAYRLDVLAELFEGIVRQHYAGIDQHDLAPRNVMLVPSPEDAIPPGCVPRVVLIDYNGARVYEYTKYGRFPSQDLSLPINPAQYFWHGAPVDFYGWAPLRWFYRHQGTRAYQEWLLTRFGGNNMSRFSPIAEKLELPPPLGIAISGPSGVGKSTLCQKLFEKYPGAFEPTVSHTTRKPRPGEVDGVDYQFVSRDKFELLIRENAFMEYTERNGNFYGTSKQTILDQAGKGALVLLDVDMEGVKQLKEEQSKDEAPINFQFVFIKPPSFKALEARLRESKSEDERSIQQRLSQAQAELEFAETGVHDKIIINENLDDAFQELAGFALSDWHCSDMFD
ncbi:P-loop containing nucleoside triphosphate hydrolase protein [Xylaria sp. FL1042]|nr:P-loop containing nucleoside triphosphate hydrolase protein [Xylaria sp. FL1042]